MSQDIKRNRLFKTTCRRHRSVGPSLFGRSRLDLIILVSSRTLPWNKQRRSGEEVLDILGMLMLKGRTHATMPAKTILHEQNQRHHSMPSTM